MKKQKGITLIALVITIIVLLILSAVAISFIVGDNGVLNQAVASKNNTLIAEYEENLKMALNSAKVNSATTGNSILEEAKALIEADEKFANAIIGDIQSGELRIETAEGFVFTVTAEGVVFDESTAGGEVGGEDEEDENKLSLTVKHLNTSGTEISQTVVNEYGENEYVTVESVNIEGYETSSVKIIAAEETEAATGGAPLKMGFPIYQDTEVIITYEEINAGESGGTGSTGGNNSSVNKDYGSMPSIKNADVPMISTSIEADNTILTDNTVQEEIEKADVYYAMDLEPMVNNNGPLTITLDMTDKAVDGDTATVMHRKENGVWEKLGTYTVENLEITITIDSFSPFVIAVKHIVTDENVGFIIGWNHYSNGTWGAPTENENELVLNEDVNIVAKICKTGNKVTPGRVIYLDRESYLTKGDELRLILEGSGDMGSLGLLDANGIPLQAYAWHALGKAWYEELTDTFYMPYITSIYIDPNITSIGYAAFFGCFQVRTVNMPNVTKIGDYAFSRADRMQSLTIPSTVQEIGEQAFSYCYNLEQVRIPANVQKIGKHAFYSSPYLQRIYLDGRPSTIAEEGLYIGDYNTTYIYVKDSVTKSFVENYIDENTEVRID